MNSKRFNRGDIIQFESRVYRVWELNGTYYGILPYPLDDEESDHVPLYVDRDSDLLLVRRQNVNPLHSLPENMIFMVETFPQTAYDLTCLRLWTDGQVGHVEVNNVVMTGVLGATDGSQTQTGIVSHASLVDLQNRLDSVGYWNMNAKTDRPRDGKWWTLNATDGFRTHSVERFGEPNEIQVFCEQCIDLVDWNRLENQPFDVA